MAAKGIDVNILKIEEVTIRFGGLTALENINLQVKQGQIHGLIGPNGSGKTTLFNIISGVYRQDTGHVYFMGQLLDQIEPYRRAEIGLTRSFQHQRTFKGMTVLENVMMGQHNGLRYGLLGVVFNRRKAKEEEERAIERALESLEFVNLKKYANHNINDLAYAEQRVVEIARVLSSDQTLMLLDEPAAGLSPSIVSEMNDILLKIRKERGISILLVEHVLSLVLNVSDHVTVLNEGKKIAEGTPDEIRNNKLVEEAYIGKANLFDEE
jgi:branched-chain amino acid transport system ATP-binding protein